ncbi:MAG: PAS domain S-box protein [Candidatus Acidiferrum sp.]|jgi:PAS domain S-box-containing protein
MLRESQATLPPGAGATPIRYLLALAATAAVLLLRWSLDRYFGGVLPCFALLASAAFAAWYCGAGPALVSTFCGFVAANYLFVTPRDSLHPSCAASTVTFLLLAGAIIVMGEQNRRNLGRLERHTVESNERNEKVLYAMKMDLELATRMAGVGTWFWDLQTGEMRWSEQQRALYARPRDKPVNVDWFFSVVHPDDRDAVFASGFRSLREKTDFRGEFRILLPDGSTRWIGSRGRPIVDERGEVIQVAGASWDISARRTAQEQLTRNEERLRLAQEAGNVGTWEWDPDADVTLWSEQKYEIFGIAPSDPLYLQTWMAAIVEKDREAVRAIRKRVQREGAAEIEYRYQHPGKGLRWMFSRLRMVPTSGGKKVMLGISIDVTERKELEEELRETAECFRSTFEYANVGMAHVGLDGRYLRVNRKLCEMLGYSPREFLELKFENLTAPEYLEEDWKQVRRLISGEVSAVQREKKYIHKSGKGVWIRVMVAVLRSADGAPQHFITVMDQIGGPEKPGA